MAHKVLIVEDEGLLALVIERMLVSLGYKFLGPCASGEEALALVAGERPDIALLDVRLQGEIDGITTARLLRERFGVGAIFVTGQSREEVLARTGDVHHLGILFKPFNLTQLSAVLESALPPISRKAPPFHTTT
jgi:CheY-like chemotaxis protein